MLDSVERREPIVPLEELVPFCREQGMTSVNLDLIYGLPYQNQKSFHQTIEKILQVGPDRLATFAYAHVPWVKGQQEKMPLNELPDAEERVSIHIQTVELMQQAGYDWVGMDHFSLPTDSLSKALNSGTLRRNFQGYCTAEHTGQVYAFGASSISQIDFGFYQNAKLSSEYSEQMESQGNALYKVYQLNDQEKYISSVIEDLMCNGKVEWIDQATRFTITEQDRIDVSIGQNLQLLEEEGLLNTRDGLSQLTEKGKWVPRYVAMHLDPLLQREGEKKKFSQTL